MKFSFPGEAWRWFWFGWFGWSWRISAGVLLDLYTAISPLRFLGGGTPLTLRGTSFAPGAMVAVALLFPILIAAAIAFRMVAKRYRGAPLEALAFTRQNPVWVLAVVVLAAVLLTFLLRLALGWSNYPLPLLEPPAGFFTPSDIILYSVSVPLTALLAGLLVFGFSYPILVARLGVWVGGLVCAVFFTLPQLAIQGVYWQPTVALLAMGIYLTVVRMRADSAYTAHAWLHRPFRLPCPIVRTGRNWPPGSATDRLVPRTHPPMIS